MVITLFSVNAFCQNSVKFDYDAGGNMTQKKVQIVNLRLAKQSETQDSILNFKVYPNPTKDQITIDGSLKNDSKEAQVFIYNINGAVVKQDTYNGMKKMYSLSGFTSGIYFLEVKYSKKESSNYKIVITE